MYLDTKEKLRKLENQCIDLRDIYSGKIFKFDKDKWNLINNDKAIVIERK